MNHSWEQGIFDENIASWLISKDYAWKRILDDIGISNKLFCCKKCSMKLFICDNKRHIWLYLIHDDSLHYIRSIGFHNMYYENIDLVFEQLIIPINSGMTVNNLINLSCEEIIIKNIIE